MFKETLSPIVEKLKSIDQTIEIALAKQDMLLKELKEATAILKSINDFAKEQRDIAQNRALIEKIIPVAKPNDNRY